MHFKVPPNEMCQTALHSFRTQMGQFLLAVVIPHYLLGSMHWMVRQNKASLQKYIHSLIFVYFL